MGIHILTPYYVLRKVLTPLVVISETEDGHIWQELAATYAIARDATTGVVSDVASYMTVGQAKEVAGFNMWRGGLFFDTTSLPIAAAIMSAVLTLKPVSGGVFSALNDANQALVIVSGEDLVSTGLVAADYGQLKARVTSFGSINKAGWWSAINAGVMAEIALNTDGIAAISKIAITIFGMRGLHDINNVPDAGTIERNRFDFQTAEYITEASRPHLTITYTI